MTKPAYTATKTDISERSEVEIRGEISADSFAAYEPRVLAHLKDTVTLPGFRKGHVPEGVIRERIGEASILHEMAEHALGDVYPALLDEHRIDPVGSPEVTITKIARGNPLGFSIRIGIFPTITLPDYRALAAKVPEDEVKKEDGDTDDTLREKAFRAKSTHRAKVIDAILEKTAIPLPPALVAAETNALFAEMRHDIERMGIRFADYLIHLKKTEDEVRTELAPSAEKRARTGLVLQAIAEKEDLKPDQEILAREVERLTKAYPDADRARAAAYVANRLINEQVLSLLEGTEKERIMNS